MSRPLKLALALILLAAAVAWTVVWWGLDDIRQTKVLYSLLIAVGLAVLLLAWLLFVSRKLFLVALAGLIVTAALVEIKGVSGDVMPIFGWRWSSEPANEAPLADRLPRASGDVQASAGEAAAQDWPASDSKDSEGKAGEGKAGEVEKAALEEPAGAKRPAMAPVPSGAPDGQSPATESDEGPGEETPGPGATPSTSRPTPTLTDDLPGAFPQFQGPRRDATFPSIRLARDWNDQPPKKLWSRAVGAGWSGFAVIGNAAITQEQRGEEELVVRYALDSGEPVWVHSDEARYSTTIGGTGPRATPTIVGDRVYTMGATGILNCLDLDTGKRHWSVNAIRDNGGEVPPWGKSGSPLVLGDLVVVSAGGREGRSLVAYDRWNGKLVWSAGNDEMGYASPRVAELGGQAQIVVFNRASLAGHDPAEGRVLWTFPWPLEQPNVSQPVVLPGDRLFASSGYGTGGKLLDFSGSSKGGFEPVLVWETRRLKAKFTDVVYHDGYLYGLDDGVFVCLDPADGERRWKRGRYGHGQTLLAGDLLLVLGEQGTLYLLEPTPEEHREIARFQVLDGKSWNFPTLAGNLLLVRNDREAVLWELPTRN